MALDDAKPISAGDIVKEPDAILSLMNEYILIRDMSPMGNYKSLIEAVNILGEYGWESLSIAGDAGGYMYALVRNKNFKHKNF